MLRSFATWLWLCHEQYHRGARRSSRNRLLVTATCTPPTPLPPPSQGRIDEQGNLQCSYHGWSFSPCGACTRIPQLPDSSPAVNSRRACATAFPVRVVFVSVARWDESLVLAVTLPAGIIAFPLSSAHQITKQDCAGIHAYVCVCVCVGEGGWGHACVRVGLCMHACVCTPFDRI